MILRELEVVAEFFRLLVGLILLFALDLFAELVVFEWLEWNGTTKNDWFFMLWWLLVALWTIRCGTRLWRGHRAGN